MRTIERKQGERDSSRGQAVLGANGYGMGSWKKIGVHNAGGKKDVREREAWVFLRKAQ